MRIGSTFNVAFRALRRNKLRSALTALGIIIGVGAVIAMVGIGSGAKAQVEAQIASLGQNVIVISTGSTTSSGIRTGWGGAGTLKIEDAEAIRRELPSVTAVSEEVPSTAQVAAGNQNWFTRVMGESPDYFDIRQWPLAEGAPFTAQDVRSANKVCVIGQTTATQVFGNDDPVGQTLRIKNVPFIVSGVLTPKGLSIQGTDQDDVVVMPYTSAMKRVGGGNGDRGRHGWIAGRDCGRVARGWRHRHHEHHVGKRNGTNPRNRDADGSGRARPRYSHPVLDRSGFAQFRWRIARHYSRHSGLEDSFGDQALAFADFARVDRAGVPFQCRRGNFLRLLSGAKGRRARSD